MLSPQVIVFASGLSAVEPVTVNLVTIILIALSLSADCFAVALSASMSKAKHKHSDFLLTALSFGIFQVVMPLLGWLAGRTVVDYISRFDHWVAFGLLAFVGGKMLWESFTEKEEERNISPGLTLITLSLATSIDALAVGLSFAFTEVNIFLTVGIIGLVAFIITSLGFLIGRKVGDVFGKRAEIIGGLVLLGIGIKILVEHLLD
jgi:manganese efflux pump family protein